jgi:hypothetical protein
MGGEGQRVTETDRYRRGEMIKVRGGGLPGWYGCAVLCCAVLCCAVLLGLDRGDGSKQSPG